MSTTTLSQFLRTLNVDPGLLAAFERDPDSVLAASGLSDQDCQLMRSADRYRALQAAQADLPAQPDF